MTNTKGREKNNFELQLQCKGNIKLNTFLDSSLQKLYSSQVKFPLQRQHCKSSQHNNLKAFAMCLCFKQVHPVAIAEKELAKFQVDSNVSAPFLYCQCVSLQRRRQLWGHADDKGHRLLQRPRGVATARRL